MKPLEKHELYENLAGFLRTKGIDLQEGSYVQAIQKSCSLLTEAINLGQSGLEQAKNKMDSKLDQVRRVIHEKTALRSSRAPAGTAQRSAKKAAIKSAGRKSRGGKPKPPRA
jgi:predicted metal-dependent hydrolase